MKIKRILDRPKGPNILILAPHPDDETFGCGGAIAYHKNMDDNITCAYICNGDSYKSKKNVSITIIKKNESSKAADYLGIKKKYYFDFSDFSLNKSIKPLRKMLEELFKNELPDSVYLPGPFDQHIDHRTVFFAVHNISNKLKKNFNCYLYEVMTPITYNYLFPIDNFINIKINAIRMYHSQLKIRNYEGMMMALSQYRGSLHPARACQKAEAFLQLKSDELDKLVISQDFIKHFFKNDFLISWNSETL